MVQLRGFRSCRINI